MQDGQKAIWIIPYFSVAFFPSLKQNFIAYRSSKVSSRPDCIFEIHQLWQSGFIRVCSNFCCSRSFEPEIINIGQSSYKILNFQESTTILNACTKKSGNLLNCHVVYYWGKRNKECLLPSVFELANSQRLTVKREIKNVGQFRPAVEWRKKYGSSYLYPRNLIRVKEIVVRKDRPTE